MLYLIDIVGTCNLRCPSCPVGNFHKADFREEIRPKGFMKVGIFKAIAEKIALENEAKSEKSSINLYNWGEAMLHPKIDDIMDIIASNKLVCCMSSNMNNDTSFTKIVRSVAALRISVSGGVNSTYQKSHAGGDINLVIANMYRLRHAMDKCNSKMHVHVLYHAYKDNCGEEMINLRNIALNLGFVFEVGLAYFMPTEKVLAYLDGSPNFNDNDRKIMDSMVLSIDEGLAISKPATQSGCALRDTQIVINYDGSVALCCTVFDPQHNVVPNFLNSSLADIQNAKMKAEICTKCMENGIHNYMMTHPRGEWEAAVISKQIQSRQKYVTRMFTSPNVVEVVY